MSLTPPWPIAITDLGKRIENRERWKGCSYRGPILLHASGLKSVREARRLCDELDIDFERARAQVGHVVGVAEIAGVVTPDGVVTSSQFMWRFRRALTREERRWWFGGFALLLDRVRALDEPVPCKGALGLWHPPFEVRNAPAVLRALEAA